MKPATDEQITEWKRGAFRYLRDIDSLIARIEQEQERGDIEADETTKERERTKYARDGWKAADLAVADRDALLDRALPSLRGTRDMCLRLALNAKGVDDHAVQKHGDDADRHCALITKIEAAIGSGEDQPMNDYRLNHAIAVGEVGTRDTLLAEALPFLDSAQFDLNMMAEKDQGGRRSPETGRYERERDECRALIAKIEAALGSGGSEGLGSSRPRGNVDHAPGATLDAGTADEIHETGGEG